MAIVLLGLAVVACSRSDAADEEVVITPLNGRSNGGGASPSPAVVLATATASPVRVQPTATPSLTELRGYLFPIAGGCLPSGDQLMPNADRSYRNGVHEGIDFYESDNCTRIGIGTSVVAARAGRVVRADLSYSDPTSAEMARYLANPNTEEALDKFRGRQVWLDHGGGVVTRYAHLEGIAQGISVGSQVQAGQLIGYVGESGTPESLTQPGTEYHLHFEVSVQADYLGKGLAPGEVRALYQRFFSP